MTTNAQLTQQINDLLSAWNQREAQFRAWLAGTPNGGPNGDGKYPLTDAAGVTQLVDSPAKLADTVGGPAGDAAAAQALAEAARDTTVTAKDRAVTAETVITGLHSEVITNRNLALLYRNDAAAFAAQLSIGRDQAVAAKTATEAARDAALISETNAATSEANALASADAAAASALQAATFNPADYYTKVASDSRYKAVGYVPSWSEITSKPVSFPPSAHGHVIADVTGLQTALDGKQAAGSYAASVHGHAISDVTGLQAALDNKQAAGSYASASHTHIIADVTGLQAALDGKQPAGSYLTGITGTMVTTALGYTPYNATNPNGYISGITSGMVTTALGYTPYNSSNPAGYITGITSGNVTTALGYTPANKAGDTFSGAITVNSGAHQAVIAADGSIELTRSGGGAYIDFKDVTSEDFDSRIQQSGNGFTLTGTVSAGSDFRAPIFYDSNNTAYYVDPANTGTALNVAGSLVMDTGGGERTVTFGFTGRSVYFFGRDSDDVVGLYDNVGGIRWQTDVNGNFTAGSSSRAPVFYDSNDTAYYVDPHGTSYLNAGIISGEWKFRSNKGNGVYSGASSAPPLQAYSDDGGAAFMSFHRGGAYAVNFGLDPDNYLRIGGWSASANRWVLDMNGNNWITGSFHAPVFYDSNNTGYYVDPSSVSYLQTLAIETERTYLGSINNDYSSGYYHFSDTQNTPNGGYGHAHIIRLNADWNVQMFFPTGNTNEPMWLRRKQSGTYSAWRRLLQEDEWIGSKLLASDGRIYGTIFYDSNNSTYYVDPSGTSNLVGLNVANTIGGYVSGAKFSNDSEGKDDLTTRTESGFWQSSTGTFAEGWPINDNGWQHMISCTHSNDGNYFAMQLAAGFFSQGLFYRSVNNNGAQAWSRVALYGNSYEAPLYANVYYDSNDTGYYINPNGESVIQTLTLFGELNLSAGTTYIDHTGTINFRNQSGYATSATLTTGGDFTASGNITAYSDARLKKNVKTVENALSLVSAMRGVTYTRKDTETDSVGVIAQEMIEVVPQVVQSGEDGTLSVAYGNLVGVLIEALKELKAEVEALKNA